MSIHVSRRLVIKMGSALLVNEAQGTIHQARLAGLAADVADLRAGGTEVMIVTSGAIAVGRRHLGFAPGLLKLEEKQAAAACGQIRLAHAYQEALASHDITVAQILLTIDDTEERRRYLNARNTISTLLETGAVPIINENDTGYISFRLIKKVPYSGSTNSNKHFNKFCSTYCKKWHLRFT